MLISSNKPLSFWWLLLAIVLILMLPSQQSEAQLYDFPIGNSPKKRSETSVNPKWIYSNLGEYRPKDYSTWLHHGATDLYLSGKEIKVYSPDTGEVKFYGGGGRAKNSGFPPIKIGRFGFLHFRHAADLFVDPERLGDVKLRTFVVEHGQDVAVRGAKNKIFTVQLGKRQFVRGVKKIGVNPVTKKTIWEDVFYFNRRFPIGIAKHPDLHVTFYDSKSAEYGSRSNLRNALTAFKFTNHKKPIVQNFRLYAQTTPHPLILSQKTKSGDMNIAKHQGVDVAVMASSFNRKKSFAGIYRLAYSVYRVLGPEEEFEGETIDETIGKKKLKLVLARKEAEMFTYDKLAPVKVDFNFHVRNPYKDGRSLFVGVNKDKHSSYLVSNTNGDAKAHWELEDIGRYPDGDYIVRVTGWNIAESKGAGTSPILNKTVRNYGVRVKTSKNKQVRKLSYIK